MLKIAVIGTGYWGKHHLRVLSDLPCKIVGIADLDKSKNKLADRYNVDFYTDYHCLKSITDAVVIVTPPRTHYKIAKYFLENKIHVLIEKPFTENYGEALELQNISENNHLVLASGHIYLYNNSIRRLKKIIEEGQLGQIYYIFINWLNLGIIRKDVDALWNFGPHPFSILNYLLAELPNKIMAIGRSYIQNSIDDITIINMIYDEKTVAQINLSWLHPRKTRDIVIVGSKKMVVFSDTEEEKKLKIFNKSFTRKVFEKSMTFNSFSEFLKKSKYLDYKSYDLKQIEPLEIELSDFIRSIKMKTIPLSDVKSALCVLKILEACEESKKSEYKWVKLKEI